MNQLKLFTALLLTVFTFGSQAQEMKYYTEQNGQLLPVTKEVFERSIDHTKNIDIYLENGTEQLGILYVRRREGKLDSVKMAQLKEFLKEKGKAIISDNELIVIDYLTAAPVDDSITTFMPQTSRKNYLKKMEKISPCQAFVVYNIEGRTQWMRVADRKESIADENNFILKLLFPAQGNYGNVAVIRSDGTYMVYLGEYEIEKVYTMMETLKPKP